MIAFVQVGEEGPRHIGTELNTIQLSIFSHRFMSIAEQMGRYVLIVLVTIATVVCQQCWTRVASGSCCPHFFEHGINTYQVLGCMLLWSC